jgi:hypothetical protein
MSKKEEHPDYTREELTCANIAAEKLVNEREFPFSSSIFFARVCNS